jgi:hypothetical protein
MDARHNQSLLLFALCGLAGCGASTLDSTAHQADGQNHQRLVRSDSRTLRRVQQGIRQALAGREGQVVDVAVSAASGAQARP